ncbi:hypothetical protein ALP99_101831 [Pseudomonas syringae pv. tomato]|uniref:Uncharacterized protein n=10 Tax=Pseudomonas syringae group TaxID=136849 RepID=A0A0P9RSE0_9PSED|nr:hypothetical protein PLA106_11021 [Pseudomonas amygdali pv. lachrymans str. M302278]KPW32104.1 hypothetical protein ALO87_101787 [Pseudomonas syringae pv. apii]KPW53186.1 hypothetical protein ALO88_101954 [Pseudomonas syringae pv. antirrhini]KPX15141.1 hypothetical protein ALO72_102546 [Pseudomonas syringae pv. delphinii]KPX71486.1 hypothetical protein ALO84_101581 [Pseudomonas syringae pv. maculicola]KPY96628.1 hypothetical protein ALO36_102890 [Pseudomonas syringae pv. tomato]KPZ17095.1 
MLQQAKNPAIDGAQFKLHELTLFFVMAEKIMLNISRFARI